MSIGDCCIEGFRSHSYCDCGVDGEYSNYFNFAMNGDGTLIAVQIERVGGVSGAYAVRIFERSGTTWALKQQINDNDFEDTYYFIAFSKDSTKLVYTTYDDIKVYTRSGDTWSLTDTLTTHVTYGGTDYGGSAWHAVIKMSDDAEVIAYTGGYTFPKDAVMIWDHGVQHLIVDEVGTEYFNWSAGVSGDGSCIFAGSQDYSATEISKLGYGGATAVSVNPGAIKVYEKVGGTWTATSIMHMSTGEITAAWDNDYWWLDHNFSSEIVSSYDGSVVAYYTAGDYHKNTTISGTPAYVYFGQMGMIQMFRKDGATWDFEQLITNPFSEGIESFYAAGSQVGYSIRMTPDGNRLMAGSQGDTSTLWDYTTSWTLTRVFDVADDLENRETGSTGYIQPWSYGYGVGISDDGDFIAIYEEGYVDSSNEFPRVWFYEACTP